MDGTDLLYYFFNVAHQLQCLRENKVKETSSMVLFQNGIPVLFFPRPSVSITFTIALTMITCTCVSLFGLRTITLLTHFIILLIFVPFPPHFHVLQTLVCCSVSLVYRIQYRRIKVEHWCCDEYDK